ncbi:MAG: hypothetical protein ACFCUN_01105 [Hyphomicrobiaceae bacterium]
MTPNLKRFAVFAVLFAGLHWPAQATGETETQGRFTISPTDGGFVRLDRRTGAMSFCRREDGRWSCSDMAGAAGAEVAPGTPTTGVDDSRESEAVKALREENARLREEIARLDALLGLEPRQDSRRPGLPPLLPRPEGRPFAENFQLPSERQVEQALDYFTSILRKFQDKLKELEDGARGVRPETPEPESPQSEQPQGDRPL